MIDTPLLVAHADWSVSPGKRWLAVAAPVGDGYRAQPPQPVGDVTTLLARLGRLAGNRPVLLGVDFPIGLPLAYAERAGVDDFVALLPQLGRGPWHDFYTVAERPGQISLYRPFYPLRPGGARRSHLVEALGLTSADALLRTCDRPQPDRPAAAPLFWTMGAQQVGKAAISGWRDLLAPAIAAGSRQLALWPFDGALAELVCSARVIVAETYPAECYRHLGVQFVRRPGATRWGKRVRAERAANAPVLLRRAREAGVVLEPALAAAIAAGFGADATGEDQFDATVGLLGLLNAVLGRQPVGEPLDRATYRIEGWILGLTAPQR